MSSQNIGSRGRQVNLWCDDWQAAEQMAVTHLGPLLIDAEHAEAIYEPEIHAFGGAEAMGVAHALFHADSHHLLRHLAEARKDHRRELRLP